MGVGCLFETVSPSSSCNSAARSCKCSLRRCNFPSRSRTSVPRSRKSPSRRCGSPPRSRKCATRSCGYHAAELQLLATEPRLLNGESRLLGAVFALWRRRFFAFRARKGVGVRWDRPAGVISGCGSSRSGVVQPFHPAKRLLSAASGRCREWRCGGAGWNARGRRARQEVRR